MNKYLNLYIDIYIQNFLDYEYLNMTFKIVGIMIGLVNEIQLEFYVQQVVKWVIHVTDILEICDSNLSGRKFVMIYDYMILL